MNHIEIYTDGACKGNPGLGGWGAVLLSGGSERELFGGEVQTTNNRMELTAVIEALADIWLESARLAHRCQAGGQERGSVEAARRAGLGRRAPD